MPSQLGRGFRHPKRKVRLLEGSGANVCPQAEQEKQRAPCPLIWRFRVKEYSEWQYRGHYRSVPSVDGRLARIVHQRRQTTQVPRVHQSLHHHLRNLIFILRQAHAYFRPSDLPLLLPDRLPNLPIVSSRAQLQKRQQPDRLHPHPLPHLQAPSPLIQRVAPLKARECLQRKKVSALAGRNQGLRGVCQQGVRGEPKSTSMIYFF